MINYLCTSPLEAIENTDAMYQEIEVLKQKFEGTVTSLFPLRKPSSLVPPQLMGLHNLRSIKKEEKNHSINHVFAAGLFHLPILYWLRKPIVYSVVGGISSNSRIPSKSYLQRISQLVVSSERDKSILQDEVEMPIEVILPSIKVDEFNRIPIALEEGAKLHLLMASAPWEQSQFASKGIQIILGTLQKIDNVHVTFLWRGLHAQHMRDLINTHGVGEKVQLIDEKADVNALLQKVHGTILLCNDPAVIKSYPHSLIESLACGRPIITTPEIPMSDMVTSRACGMILPQFSKEALQNLFVEFRGNYHTLQENTISMPKSFFAPDEKLASYGRIYSSLK